jgi:hypothetical protein
MVHGYHIGVSFGERRGEEEPMAGRQRAAGS